MAREYAELPARSAARGPESDLQQPASVHSELFTVQGCIKTQTDRQPASQPASQPARQTDRQTDRQPASQPASQPARQTDRQTDRQANHQHSPLWPTSGRGCISWAGSLFSLSCPGSLWPRAGLCRCTELCLSPGPLTRTSGHFIALMAHTSLSLRWHLFSGHLQSPFQRERGRSINALAKTFDSISHLTQL